MVRHYTMNLLLKYCISGVDMIFSIVEKEKTLVSTLFFSNGYHEYSSKVT